MLSLIIKVFAMIMPWTIKRHTLINFFDSDIDKDSYIGFSFVNVNNLTMKKGARIGHLNIINNLECLYLGSNSSIHSFNKVIAHPKNDSDFYSDYKNRNTSLILDDESAVTSHHYIDCTDQIKIGKFSTIAGYNSQILTHSVDLGKSMQSCYPVVIGEYCFISTSTVILPNSKIGDKIIISANSVVKGELLESNSIYSGNRAKLIKSGLSYKYFRRNTGKVT